MSKPTLIVTVEPFGSDDHLAYMHLYEAHGEALKHVGRLIFWQSFVAWLPDRLRNARLRRLANKLRRRYGVANYTTNFSA